MPLIVVGADTPTGRLIIDGMDRDGETRAFVTDPGEAARLRAAGIKVAVGDVSDDSHVESASSGCFSAVLVVEAASDGRERSFASSPRAVLEGWARAVSTARVHRVIWVGAEHTPEIRAAEVATIGAGDDVATRVAALDDAYRI